MSRFSDSHFVFFKLRHRHPSFVMSCSFTNRGRLHADGPWSSACRWPVVVCGWSLVPKTGRLRMARGRLRMARGSQNGSSTDGLWPSTDGPWSSTDGPWFPKRVVYGWPMVPKEVVFGWPLVVYGWPVVPKGVVCGRPVVVFGWPLVVYGWPVVVCGWLVVIYEWPVVICGWPWSSTDGPWFRSKCKFAVQAALSELRCFSFSPSTVRKSFSWATKNGSSADGAGFPKRVVYGWPVVVCGRPVVVYG